MYSASIETSIIVKIILENCRREKQWWVDEIEACGDIVRRLHLQNYPAIDYMSNDKQGRNNLIRIAVRRGAAMCRNRIARRYFGDWRAIQTDFRGLGRDEGR